MNGRCLYVLILRLSNLLLLHCFDFLSNAEYKSKRVPGVKALNIYVLLFLSGVSMNALSGTSTVGTDVLYGVVRTGVSTQNFGEQDFRAFWSGSASQF